MNRMVCWNGELMPETEVRIPLTDRSFLYGDALFETLRLYGGRAFAWQAHLDRLRRGARVLGLAMPEPGVLLGGVERLVDATGLREAVLRVHLSRGSGARGYSPVGAGPAWWLMTLQTAPEVTPENPRPVRLKTVSWRLPSGASLAACKSASRLIQVLASKEAVEGGADEALLLNDQDEVAEAAGANFFWVKQGAIRTTPLESGALDGVTRQVVLNLAERLGLEARAESLKAQELPAVESAFLTSSVQELQPVVAMDGRELAKSMVVQSLHDAYSAEVRSRNSGSIG